MFAKVLVDPSHSIMSEVPAQSEIAIDFTVNFAYWLIVRTSEDSVTSDAIPTVLVESSQNTAACLALLS